MFDTFDDFHWKQSNKKHDKNANSAIKTNVFLPRATISQGEGERNSAIKLKLNVKSSEKANMSNSSTLIHISANNKRS